MSRETERNAIAITAALAGVGKLLGPAVEMIAKAEVITTLKIVAAQNGTLSDAITVVQNMSGQYGQHGPMTESIIYSMASASLIVSFLAFSAHLGQTPQLGLRLGAFSLGVLDYRFAYSLMFLIGAFLLIWLAMG